MLRRVLSIAVGVLFIADVIALVAMPSGARNVAGVIPDNATLVMSRSLDNIRVLVIKQNRNLRLVVAYRQRSRWHSVRVAKAPAGSHAAWAATEGSGPVPAFSAVYGRAPGDKVVVRWKDGKTSPVVPEKGVYLALRRGHFRPEGVDLNPAPGP
jgi:hypothetical protein